MVITTTSPEETKACAAQLIAELRQLHVPHPILLFGELGSGKTTFVKGIARAFELPERIIKSPTFTYAREIELPNNQKLHHMDLYRCKDMNQEYLEIAAIIGRSSWLVIEWPEHLATLPEKRVEVHFTITGNDTRDITKKQYG